MYEHVRPFDTLNTCEGFAASPDTSAPPSTSAPFETCGTGCLVVEGTGSLRDTVPLELPGGEYEVAVQTYGGDCEGAEWYMRRAEDDAPVVSFTQTGFVYAVDAGRHLFDAVALDDCQWRLYITPLAG